MGLTTSITSVLDLPAGLHSGVPASVYHARHPGLVSKSALDLVHRSPLHYKSWLDGAEEELTPALAFGAAFHCALLEPDVFDREYASAPDFGDCRKPDNRKARDAWREKNASRKRLSESDDDAITRMVEAVQGHPLAGRMMRDGEPELTVRWTDADTGLQCKSRADYYVRSLGMIVDIKSTCDASYQAFRRDIVNYRYHVQDGLYRDGFAAAGAPVKHFVFVAVEKTPPYAIGVYTLDDAGVAIGYAAAHQDIATLAKCIKSNEWPGYPVSIRTIDLPPWAA